MEQKTNTITENDKEVLSKTNNLRILFTSVFVNDQDKALKFYTNALGFVKKSDVSSGNYRWLTLVAPDNQMGIELVLEPNSNPAAKTYQQAIFGQNIPAAKFTVSDVQAKYKQLKELGVKFTKEPAEVMKNVIIAIFDDSVGNLIQIQQTPQM